MSTFASRTTITTTTTPFYGHYTGLPTLPGTSNKELVDFVGAKFFSACMPLLTATSASGLGRRRWSSPQQCYLHCLHTLFWHQIYSKEIGLVFAETLLWFCGFGESF